MPGKAFFDTNILIYAVAKNDPRGPRAEALLAAGGVVGVQVLNEFISVVRRKMRMPWKDVTEALDAIRVLCPSPVPVTFSTHETALRVPASGKPWIVLPLTSKKPLGPSVTRRQRH